MRALLVALMFVVANPVASLAGQSSAPQPPPPATTPAPAPPAKAPAETYAYDPDGRRDPFVSLLGATNEPRSAARRGDGLPGFTVAEISVRGIMQSGNTLVAMIQGPDNKTYLVHPGDKLLDGTVKAITPQGLVIVQEVNDPLSLVKQREVRRLLRAFEDAKE